MNFIKMYPAVYLLDLLLGDPDYPFHPIRIIGKLITFSENILYKLKNKKIAGGLLLLSVLGWTFLSSFFLAKLGFFIQFLFLYTTLAGRCLGDEGIRVLGILEKEDIILARKELSYLVSRDTGTLDENQIIRGIVETISENSVDGVIAPMFYAFLGSFITVGEVSLALPFAMSYKAVNTLDSMVGYKNERYLDFGMCSAKFDDFLNFIPARLAGGVFIPIAGFLLRMDYRSAWKIFFRDRANHSSPNSGNPESAFAGALGIQFGGKTSYFGEIFEKPTIGDKHRELRREDIKKSCNLLYASSGIALLFFLGIAYFIGGIN